MRCFANCIAVVFALLVFTSCDSGVLEGTLAWGRQDWPRAISAFLEVEKKAQIKNDPVLSYYAHYGLASAYVAQEEFDAARSRLALIDESAPESVLSSAYYQAGIISFRGGDFEDAAQYFRKSLEIGPDSLDARINLELSKRSLVDADAKMNGSAISGIEEDAGDNDGQETIFNLVKRKEQDRWKNQEAETSRRGLPDY